MLHELFTVLYCTVYIILFFMKEAKKMTMMSPIPSLIYFYPMKFLKGWVVL